jgi:hypothetical protein
MNLLESISAGKEAKPPRIMIYGIEGIGKSLFSASAPKAVFLQTEDGLSEIDCHKFPLAKNLTSIFSELEALAKEDHDYQTVVIDSCDWLERLIFDEVCREHGAKNIERVDGGYARGYTHALTHWRKIIHALEALRDNKGMACILIAHSKIEKFEDPESSAYDRYSPRLHKHANALISEWVDAVLFATRKFRTQKEDAGFNRERTIAAPLGADGGERIIRTVGGPACVAKNRFNLPAELPLSWNSLMSAMADGGAVK